MDFDLTLVSERYIVLSLYFVVWDKISETSFFTYSEHQALKQFAAIKAQTSSTSGIILVFKCKSHQY